MQQHGIDIEGSKNQDEEFSKGDLANLGRGDGEVKKEVIRCGFITFLGLELGHLEGLKGRGRRIPLGGFFHQFL